MRGDDEAPATDALPVTPAQHALDPRGQAPRFAEGDDECSYLDDAAYSAAEESPEGEEQDDCPRRDQVDSYIASIFSCKGTASRPIPSHRPSRLSLE